MARVYFHPVAANALVFLIKRIVDVARAHFHPVWDSGNQRDLETVAGLVDSDRGSCVFGGCRRS